MGAQYSQLVFQPSPTPNYSPESLPEIIWIENSLYAGSSSVLSRNSLESDTTIGRRIPAIFYEWKGRNGETAHFTILMSTGNGDDLYSTRNWAEILKNSLNVNIFCYEYTGYGINRGSRPSEKQCYEDIQTAFNYLTQTKRIPSDQIILFGKSIGTGPTVHLASQLYLELKEQTKSYTKTLGRRFTKKLTSESWKEEMNAMGKEVAGVILQSPMTSVLDIHPEIKNALLSDMFENDKKIKSIRCSIMIIHGTKDQIIPIKHSKRLMKHVSETTHSRFIELAGADHDDIESDFSDEYLDELVEFINSLTPKSISEEQRKNASKAPREILAAPINVVNDWLSKINLQEYRDKFLGAGYYDMFSLFNLTESDLDAVGVEKMEDRRLILRHSASSRSERTSSLKNLQQSLPVSLSPKITSPSKDPLATSMPDLLAALSPKREETPLNSPPKVEKIDLVSPSKKEGRSISNFIRRASTRKYNKESLEALRHSKIIDRSSVDSTSSNEGAPRSPDLSRAPDSPPVMRETPPKLPLSKQVEQLKIDFSPIGGGATPPPSPREIPNSPMLNDKWKHIDGMMNDLAEKQKVEDAALKGEEARSPQKEENGNEENDLENFKLEVELLPNTSTRPRSLSIYKNVPVALEKEKNNGKEREVKHMQTKLQLLEKIVVSQNELITSLNQKLIKIQQSSDEKDEVIRQLTESLTQVKTQLSTISGASTPASFRSPVSTFSSPDTERPPRKSSHVTEKRALYKAAYDQFVGELEKENGLTT